MSDLYERLQAEAGRRNPWRAPKLWDAFTALLELHKPEDIGGRAICTGCRIEGVAFVWWDRCKTVRAIARALDVQLEET